jgi:hypothetical protein
MNPAKFSADEELERQIAAAHRRLCDAPTRDEKMQHWREMCRLIDRRSPEQIARMEAAIR